MLYVDDARGNRPGWPQRPHAHPWCHLVATRGENELHGAAAKLGLPASAYRALPVPHYELTTAQRRVAVRDLKARALKPEHLAKLRRA